MGTQHCERCGITAEDAPLVRDTNGGTIYCDICAITLRNICWGTSFGVLLVRDGANG